MIKSFQTINKLLIKYYFFLKNLLVILNSEIILKKVLNKN